MIDFLRFPDTEAAVRKVLADAGICNGRVYSSIPATPTWPLATVKRLGGLPPEEHKLDRARIQVDVFGNNKAEARDWADLARIAVHRAESTTIPDFACRITRVEDELGLLWLPDELTDRDRYLFAVAVHAQTTFVT